MLSHFKELKDRQLIILDANFILIPSQFGIDYVAEIREIIPGKLAFIVFRFTIEELISKAKREKNKTKFQKQLDLSLQILKKQEYHEIPLKKRENEKVDDFLIRICQELINKDYKIHLATNDKELRSVARELGINVIYMRQEKRIVSDRYD